MSKSNYLEESIINHIYRTATFGKPASIYVALFTDDPGETGGTEVTGGNYARAELANSDANWADPTGTGQTSNSSVITFPAPSADWGQVQGFATYDAPTGGNMLHSGLLGTPKTVNNGDPAPTFAAGALVITEQ